MAARLRRGSRFFAIVLIVMAGASAHAMPLGPDVAIEPLAYTWIVEGETHTAWSVEAIASPGTFRSRLSLHDGTLDGVDTLHLGTLVDKDNVPLFELHWARDTSLWGLGWRLQLRHLSADGQGPASERTLGRPVPIRGHVYESMVSYDPATGTMDYSVSDLSDGIVVQKGSVGVAPATSEYHITVGYALRERGEESPISLDAFEYFPGFLPVGSSWDVGEMTASGLLLPTWRFDLDRNLTVALKSVSSAANPGTFRVTYEGAEGEIELVTGLEAQDGALLQVPATSLPLGTGRLHLDYVADGAILLQDSKEISIGQLQVRLDHRAIEASDGMWHTAALAQSVLPMGDLPLRIDAVFTQWNWDATGRDYVKVPVTTHTLFDGTLDISAGGTHIPLGIPAPVQDGTWELRFDVTSTVSTSVNVVGDRLYDVPNRDGSVQVCTYNMLGFKGWPEEAASRSIGRMSYNERLAYFAGVLDELGCDILGVQEGLSHTWLLALAEAAGTSVSLFHTPTSFPGAIFSDFPVLEQRDFTSGLRSSTVPFSRTAGAVLLDINGEAVWVVNIHAHPNRQDSRDAEAVILADELDELLKVSEHAVVIGDYNSAVGTIIHNTLKARGFLKAMELAGGGVTHTMTNLQGDGRLSIDHIYVSPSLIGKVRSARVVSDPGFRLPRSAGPDVWVHSDHLPVAAVLEL